MSNQPIEARDIAQALEEWADPAFAEPYDNVGLHVGSASRIVTRALIALDLTPAIVDEAVKKGASMIVTHHPLLFRPPSTITDEDFIGQLILWLAKENITLYSIHTNLDAADQGVSIRLAENLGLNNISFLSPHENRSSGMGAIGTLSHPEPLRRFLERIHERLESPILRYAGSPEMDVNMVAVCGGSGGSLITSAIMANADVFVTADLTYHRYFEVLGPHGDCRMALVDAGHYETEKHTEQILRTWLQKRFPSVTFFTTNIKTSPILYSTR